MKTSDKQVFIRSKPRLYAVAIILLLMVGSGIFQNAEAQLLEQGKGRLKTIKRESRGFIFFRRKVKSEDPNEFRRGKAERVNVRYSVPPSSIGKDRKVSIRYSIPSFSRKDKKVNVRYSQVTPYNPKQYKANPRYSLPPFSEKDKKVNVRYSIPRKQTFYDIWITQQLKNKRRIKPSATNTDNLYGKSTFSFIPFFKKTRPGPMPDVAGRYTKSRLWIHRPWVYRNKLSITTGATYKFDERLKEQFRPINGYTLSYQGDLKRRIPILEKLRKRMGQWEKSSYQGHHKSWSKFGRHNYLKGTSSLAANYQGQLKELTPFLKNIRDKMNLWEQTHYQGRSTGWSELGRKAYLKGTSSLAANYEGNIKVKRRKGGDMHPSIAYISGKRFANSTWKERWRKLNVLWVRLNPGKEVSDGTKEKIKVKYDKEERDIWTY